MINKLIVVFCILLAGCTNVSSLSSTSILKTCIDTLLKTKDYGYLNSGKIIIVKNSFTQNIDVPSLKNENIKIESVDKNKMDVYSPQVFKRNLIRYAEITEFSNTEKNAAVVLKLLNVNEILKFKLAKTADRWHVKSFNSIVN